MIDIRMLKSGEYFIGMMIKGHAKHAEYGKDIVCASVSTLFFACTKAFTYVLDVKFDVDSYGEDGKAILLKDENKTASIIFEVAYITFIDLMTKYPSNLEVSIQYV